MRKLLPRILAAAALLALLASCPQPGASLGRHALLIGLPPAPPAWASLPGLRYAVSWRSADGVRRSALAAPGSCLRIEVGRGFPQAILAAPDAAGRELRPAGALYPEALAGALPGKGVEELSLDWTGGYAASVALALEREGIDPGSYRLRALADEALDRSGDPWLLPAAETARRLAAGAFRMDVFRRPTRFELSLPVEGGPWAPESPFAERPGDAGELRLPAGLWRFVGAGEELFASVDEGGRAAFLRR
jgi:hypothetical protein